MADHYDDIEQSEAVKKWLRDNGSSIVLGAVVGLGGIFGWQYWQDREASQAANAASTYNLIQQDAATEELQILEAEFNQLKQDYQSSPYATLGALQVASKALDAGDLELAEKELRFAAENANPPAVATIAKLRLARILIASERPEEVLALLDTADVTGFEPAAAEVRGDALVRLGRLDEARVAYEDALAAGAAGLGGSLEMKLNDLPAGADS